MVIISYDLDVLLSIFWLNNLFKLGFLLNKMSDKIPYVREHLIYNRLEKGPVDSGDLLTLLKELPKTRNTADFHFPMARIPHCLLWGGEPSPPIYL